MSAVTPSKSSAVTPSKSNVQKPADLLKTLHGLSQGGLASLLQAAQKEQADRQQKVKDVYGQWFSDGIGLDRLYNLPEAPASELGLGNVDHIKYPSRHVLPSHLKDVSAVRGVMGVECPRPFIAIKTEVLDPTTKKVVAVVVELIFKRYALTGDGAKGALHEDNYVTALEFESATSGGRWYSNLYSGGGISNAQLTAIRELLEGKTIKAPVGKNWIRMAPGKPLDACPAKA